MGLLSTCRWLLCWPSAPWRSLRRRKPPRLRREESSAWVTATVTGLEVTPWVVATIWEATAWVSSAEAMDLSAAMAEDMAEDMVEDMEAVTAQYMKVM